jgi:capsular exopolysaccharide synthesis family protein
MTPMYRATTRLQIERHNPDVLTFRDLAQVDYAWSAYSDFYETQYKLIASTAVARIAVERLGLTSHPEFVQEPSAPGILDRVVALIPRKTARTTTTAMSPDESTAVALLAALEIAPVRNSQLVDVAWISSDPELAADVANAMADAYIHFNIASQNSASGEAKDFLVDQIGNLKKEIAGLEESLQDYGEAKGIISIDDTNNITLQALQDIAAKRTEAQTTLARAEARFKAVSTADPDALPEVMNSDLIGRLRQESAIYEAEYSEMSRKFNDSWPGIQTLKSKLEQSRLRLDLETERIASQVRASAEGSYDKALNEVENLDRLLVGQEAAAQRLKRDAVDFNNLQSEVKKRRETLNALIARRNEMALSSQLMDESPTSTNVRVMERAKPPLGPFRPNTRLNLMIGLAFGFLLGVGIAFLLDYLDNTINSADELSKLTSLPVLAVVPRHGPAAQSTKRVRRKPAVAATQPFDLVTEAEGRSVASEAYRGLRTSLLLSNPGRPPRKIMITSALPEEGKTATAINLAVVLAQLGGRVLLIDTDLRRPRVHKPFNVENRVGASTYLSGLEQDPGRVVVSSGISNLDLILSGPIPPNPSELLNSTRFAEMAEELLKQGYDHLIFDSPPALPLSDPIIISSIVDFGILVVRAGRTPRQSVRVAAEKLLQTGKGRFGAILNGFESDSRGASYHHYYYHTDDEQENLPKPAQVRARNTGA